MTNKEQWEKLVELLNHNVCQLDEFTGCKGCGYLEVEDCRASAMADYLIAHGVTVREKGEWVLLDNCSNEGWYCSLCHKKVYRADASYANVILPSKYCPNCGADMRKGDNNGC